MKTKRKLNTNQKFTRYILGIKNNTKSKDNALNDLVSSYAEDLSCSYANDGNNDGFFERIYKEFSVSKTDGSVDLLSFLDDYKNIAPMLVLQNASNNEDYRYFLFLSEYIYELCEKEYKFTGNMGDYTLLCELPIA